MLGRACREGIPVLHLVRCYESKEDQGLGFGGLGVQGLSVSGFRVQGWVWGLGVQGFRFYRAQDLGLREQ